MVIGLVWLLLALLYWTVFLLGAVFLHLRGGREKHQALRAQAAYWGVIAAVVTAAWFFPLPRTFLAIPVVFPGVAVFGVFQGLLP